MKFQENVGHDGWIYCFFIVFFPSRMTWAEVNFLLLKKIR